MGVASGVNRGPDVVCLGAAALDLLAVVEELPGPDGRVAADTGMLAGGGPAATAAVAVARLGGNVELVARVADDLPGRLIRQQLQDEGVGTRWLTPGGGDARSALASGIVRAGPPPTRSLVAVAARPPLGPDDLAPELIDACRQARWLHVDHAGWPLVPVLRGMGVTALVSVDGGNPIAGLDPSMIDLYVPSLTELRRWTGTTDVEAALARALDEGARAVVATRGEAGAAYLGTTDPDSAWDAPAPPGVVATTRWRLDVPAHPVTVVSTLGAGDVYHGALLAALVRGATVRAAMTEASVAAALACRALDGRGAIPDHAELRTALAARPSEPSPSWRPHA